MKNLSLEITLATLTRFELYFNIAFGDNRYFGDVEVSLRKCSAEIVYRHVEDLCYTSRKYDLPERFLTELEEEPFEKVPEHITNLARNIVRDVFADRMEEP